MVDEEFIKDCFDSAIIDMQLVGWRRKSYPCPECTYIEDDQYCCTTCWSESRQIYLKDLLKDNFDLFVSMLKKEIEE